MSHHTTKSARPTHSPDLTARLWVLAGMLGIAAGVALVATGALNHFSASVEALMAVVAGWLIMLASAPWRRVSRGHRDRAEIRRITRTLRTLSHDRRREPLRTLLTHRDDDLGELGRAIYDTLTDAAADRLQARLLRSTMDHTIRRETHRAAGRLRRQAVTDPLTGLGNRRARKGQLARLLESAKRDAQPVSAMMIDVDEFKQINDRLGHAVGDQCLAFLGKQLQAGLRHGDCAFRIGGDEFIVVIPGQTLDVAKTIAKRISALFSTMPWPHEQPGQPTLSIGVVSAAANEITGPDDLIRCADEAMYAAKRSGRAQVVAYNELRGAA